ncbi:AAA domain-containing protein, putative AbiEii toxin, Type IV TA system [Pseudooceanicola antarcticus]|nr:ATP-binding protein [Pseudooceanicola antarcticus]SNY58213.1 AAA domain-containing protein, putative AbiEii toxin, Type IV TA system [Pseudooceanicola antarcticus]
MSRITFLVGPNGCGKTRELVRESGSIGDWPYHTAAVIANTPFVRFERRTRNRKVFRVSPAGINRVVSENLRNFFDSEGRDTFDISDLLEAIGFFPDIDLDVKVDKVNDFDLDKITTDLFEVEALSSILDILGAEGGGRFELSRHNDSFMRSLRGRNRILFKYIRELKREKLVASYDLIFRHRGRAPQIFAELSSGEQTLISTFLFIRSTLPSLGALFIDEPENSLHPEWQRRYLEILHMALGYHEAKIYLATHSPVVVSGALSSYGDDVEVVRVDGDARYPVEINQTSGPESVEEILWEAFDTITPVSHFLSIELSRVLQRLTDGQISQQEAENEIHSFKKRSYDNTQRELLSRVLDNIKRFSQNG